MQYSNEKNLETQTTSTSMFRNISPSEFSSNQQRIHSISLPSVSRFNQNFPNWILSPPSPCDTIPDHSHTSLKKLFPYFSLLSLYYNANIISFERNNHKYLSVNNCDVKRRSRRESLSEAKSTMEGNLFCLFQ
jgi:hypothetical protein